MTAPDCRTCVHRVPAADRHGMLYACDLASVPGHITDRRSIEYARSSVGPCGPEGRLWRAAKGLA